MSGIDRVRHWLAVRHSLPAELLVVVGLYALYESTRGVVAGRRDIAFIVVATGNHFLFDVGVGAIVDVLAATAAVLLLRDARARSVAVPALR